MEASTRLALVQHQVTLRGGGELARPSPVQPSWSGAKRDKDREWRRKRLLSRSMVYVNQVASASASALAQRRQFDAGREISHQPQGAPIGSAPGTRRRRMSDFSDQTLAKLNDLKLDEAPPSTNTGPQAGLSSRQAAQQRPQMELAEAQQEQPLVMVSASDEARFGLEAARFGQHQHTQQQQQLISHFSEPEQSQLEPGGRIFAGQSQGRLQASGSFPLVHQLAGLGEMRQQPAPLVYHEAPAGPLFLPQAQHHSHAAYYPLLVPAHQTVDLAYSQAPAANYADLDETTRQRQQQRQAIGLKSESVELPDSVLRLNQMAERSHQRLASSNDSSHELRQSNHSKQVSQPQQQQQQQQQYYDDNNRFSESGWHELTQLDRSGSSWLASSGDKPNQSTNYERQQCQQQQQRCEQLMSNSMAAVGSSRPSLGPRSLYVNQSEDQLVQSAMGQFGALAAEQLCAQSPADNADELKVCEWFGCSSTFLDMAEFVRHLEEVHVNQEPREKSRYFCMWSNCKRNNQEFNARYKLLIHMRVHSGEKPYACKSANCKKSFSRLENLKIHQRSHTGHKPYKCTHGCSKSFTNSSDRIKHHKTHKDPKPYNCTMEGCTKRYTDPSSLRKHLRAHKRHVRDTNQPPGQLLYSSSERLHHSTLSSCELNSSGYQNSSSYHNYSSPVQQAPLHYQSGPLYGQQQQQQENTVESYPLPADYDPAQDFEQTYFAQDDNPNYSTAQQEAEQQFSRSFRAPSQVGLGNLAQRPAQQHYDAPQTQRLGARSRLELSVQHQALSRSWCAGAGPTRPNRQRAPFAAHPLQRPLNSSDNLLSLQQQQQHQEQHARWTASQQPWPSGGESFATPASDNNRQLQEDAIWGQNQFVSNEQQCAQHEQLMRSMPSPGDTFAHRPHWLASEADLSARWQMGAK